MALSLSVSASSLYTQSIHQYPLRFSPTNSNNRNFLSPIHLHRSSPPSASNSCRPRAVNPGRQPPPESEPPSGKDPSPSEGLTATFGRLQDTVQIFFAVLFWMSLFFWSSVWDGSNNDRPGKGPRFRR